MKYIPLWGNLWESDDLFALGDQTLAEGHAADICEDRSRQPQPFLTPTAASLRQKVTLMPVGRRPVHQARPQAAHNLGVRQHPVVARASL